MDYLTFPLRHLSQIRDWLKNNDAAAAVSPIDFALTIRYNNRLVALKPRFIVSANKRLAYTEHFSDDAVFVGWYAYSPRRWDISSDKGLFKDFAKSSGINVPMTLTIPPYAQDYVIKKNSGSFGETVRGPYQANNEKATAQPGPDEFAEAFTLGKSAKAWYWAGRPVALEIVSRPFITGDGSRSLGELAASPRGSFDLSYSLESSASVLAWQGFDAASVVQEGQSVYLDYRHASAYDRVVKKDQNVWEKTSKSLRQQFEAAGLACIAHVAHQDSKNRLFTIDAIVDPNGKAWFLEINSNPMVHPRCYAPMLDALFEVSTEQARRSDTSSAEALSPN